MDDYKLNIIINELERRKDQVETNDDGSFCSWADENYWMTLDEIEDFVESLLDKNS